MASLMIKSVVLFVCLVITLQCRAEDLPIRFEDQLALLNGHFDNIQQEGDRLHDRIEIKGKPVLIPGLQKDEAFYFVETINGKLYRRIVGVRNESSTDTILYINYYNFTDSSQYNPETFDTDDLANLTREDFRLDEGCHLSYTKPSPEILLAEVYDCRHSVNGKHPTYTVILTCESLRFEPSPASDETASLIEYDLKHKGPRFPMINPPEGYVNPCQDGL